MVSDRRKRRTYKRLLSEDPASPQSPAAQAGLIIVVALILLGALARGCGDGLVHVRGYDRANGTHVESYTRHPASR